MPIPITYRNLTNNVFQQIINCLFPQPCFLCGDINTQAICTACLNDLPYLQTTCIYCGADLPISDVCGDCTAQPPIFNQAKALFSYSYPVNILIQAAKFQKNFAILKMLGDLMGQHFKHEKQPDVLIPIPLHFNRLHERGYNQSLEMAKCIALHTNIDVDNKVCQRIKDTPHQVKLSAKERRRNLKGAFRVKNLPAQWQHIVLIDDVITTGSTVNELAKVLFNAGVQRVDVWCCART